MRQRLVHLVLLVLMPILLFGCATQAIPLEPDCSNPKVATDSLLVWLNPDHYDEKKATRCVEVPEGADPRRLAVQLKQVVDARGLYVPIPSMPDDPDYEDEDGRHRILPLGEQAPWYVVERNDDGDWVYTRETMAQVPGLYEATFSPLSLWFQNNLPGVFYTRVGGFYLWQFLYATLLVVGAWLIATIVRVIGLGWTRRILRRVNLTVDEKYLRGINQPLFALVLAAILMWGLPDLQLTVGIAQTLRVAASVVLGLAGIFFATRLVDIFAEIASSKADKTDSKLDDQLIPLARQAAKLVVWVIGALFVLQNNGVQVWSFVAGLGIGSLAFALAAQDSIANLFGALNIFLDKPFQIGDWVVIGAVEGTIEEVGFRSVRVRTFYNSLVTIPNSTITNTNVDNMGARHRRRVKLMLGLTYDTPPAKLQAFVEGVRAILAAHPAVERTYQVHFYNFGGSSLDILVYYHLVVPDWTGELEARSQNFLEFLRLAEELGVSFAFPSQSLYLESTPDKPLPRGTTPVLGELEATVDAFGPAGRLARPGGVPFSKSWSVDARRERGEVDDEGPG